MSCTQRCNQGRSCACSYRRQFNHIGELRNPKFTIADRVTFALLMLVIVGFIVGAFQ